MNTPIQHSLKNSIMIYFENEVFVNVTYNYVIEKFPKKYGFRTKKQLYGARIIIVELLYITKTALSYKNYRGPVNAKTLNRHSIFFAQNKIFENVYELMHIEYLKYNGLSKLKTQSIDTTYIMNINGKEELGRNTHFKNKNCYKVSIIVDSNSIPHSTVVVSGNKNDAKIGEINVDMTKKRINELNLKCKPYMLADRMYDTSDFRQKCINVSYRPIIDYNKRNTKNKKLIKKLTKNQKTIYKKRIRVENRFCILKKYRRVHLIYDSYLMSYKSFLYLAECCMIKKYIGNPKITYIVVPSYAIEIMNRI